MKLTILLISYVFANVILRDENGDWINRMNHMENMIWGLQCWNWRKMDCPFYNKRSQTCKSKIRPPHLPREFSVETNWPYPSNRNCVYNIRCSPRTPVIQYYGVDMSWVRTIIINNWDNKKKQTKNAKGTSRSQWTQNCSKKRFPTQKSVAFPTAKLKIFFELHKIFLYIWNRLDETNLTTVSVFFYDHYFDL